jgi:cytosine/adenosine deaminase-related metal-dependent hydrolase
LPSRKLDERASSRGESSVAAEWVLPIAGPPIRHGSVTIHDGRVVAVGSGRPDDAVDLGRCAVLPALVNAHTHLELSWLRGRIPRAARFTDWVRPLLAARGQPSDPAEIEAAALRAIEEARASGTAVFGDVSNTLSTVPILRGGLVAAHVFHELLGFNVADASARVVEARARIAALGPGRRDDVHVSLAPHAPYSVAPALFDAIRRDVTSRADRTTVHLAESREEVELLADGHGPWRELLELLRVWSDEWTPPGVSPVAFLADRGFLDASVLVVHAVECTPDDIRRLAASGATVVTCPRSNAYVGAGVAPLAAFVRAGVPVAFGTDSLASVDDLNLFTELAEARRIAPEVPARTWLEGATATGARALGFGDQFGTIEPGKRAALIAVRVPDGVTDVEEYLVSGIAPADVSWAASGWPAAAL